MSVRTWFACSVVLSLLTSPVAAQTSATVEVLKNLEWRNIGPANMMGRVADVEGVPSNPNVLYVGSASGGVWKTADGGVSFKPLFDKLPYLSIGDMALEPGNPDVLYVGTGEGNPRNSVSFGNGVYKSTDGGESWRHVGLADTRNIARVVVSPREPSKVYVAALGHLFGLNAERGVFRSLNGGGNWEKVLFVDDRHGASDLDVDPVNPNVLYAALWYFDRTSSRGGPMFRIAILSLGILSAAPLRSQERRAPPLPPVAEGELPNGLKLLVLEDPSSQTVSFQVLILGAGGYYDPGDARGLARFTAEMMREGTTTRSARDIVEKLDTMAGALDVSVGMGNQAATFSGSSLPESFPTMVELVSDVLLHPAFKAGDLELFKARTRGDLLQQRSSGEFLAAEQFLKIVHGDHPASVFGPTVPGLERVRREDLVGFHEKHYVPDYAVFGVTGNVKAADVRKTVESRLGAWRRGGIPRPAVLDAPVPSATKVLLVNRPGSVQTALVVGAPAIPRHHEDYDTLLLLNRVLGEARTGRLIENLRFAKGYASVASSNLTALNYRGDWRASTLVRTDVTEAALGDVLAEIAKARDQKMSEAELTQAKRAMIAAYTRSLASPAVSLTNHIIRWAYGFPSDYWDRYPDRILAVTADQIQAAAKTYLDPSRLQVVAVGDAGRIGEGLKRFGKVETAGVESVSIEN